ncbi:MAG: FAD/NAD(P)-binding protein, partial [Fusobacteriaceae bacterium]
MKKQVVIIGAGYAGVLTAKHLEKRLKSHDCEITIINKSRYHVMKTELHEVAAERVEERNVCMDLKNIFYGRKVTV